MTNPGGFRANRSAEEAAAETEEPEEAARVRAEDDAETRARQEETAAGLREADRALVDGGQRLRATRVALNERERELARTSDLTQEVARSAAELRAQTTEIAEQARKRRKESD